MSFGVVGESRDHITESWERFVDVLGFIQNWTLSSSLANLWRASKFWIIKALEISANNQNNSSITFRTNNNDTSITKLKQSFYTNCVSTYLLTTSQIHKIQLSEKFLLRLNILLFHLNQEDTVTSWTVFIHVCTKIKLQFNYVFSKFIYLNEIFLWPAYLFLRNKI